jgi:hypothetical protein
MSAIPQACSEAIETDVNMPTPELSVEELLLKEAISGVLELWNAAYSRRSHVKALLVRMMPL